jgi:predicted Zn-dependent peptidase
MIKNIKGYNIKYEELTLSNGSKVFMFIKKNSPIYFRAYFRAGSMFDNNKKGLAHFVEHMLLAGTKLYPTKSILNEKISELGAKRNATTGNNKIYVTFDVAEESDFLPILDIFDQIINYPIFDEDAIEKERGVILSEQAKRVANPELHVYEIENSLILQDTIMETPSIGKLEDIKKITRDDIINYYEGFIKNGQVSYFIFGDFNSKKVIKKIESVNINKNKIKKDFNELNLSEKKDLIIEKQDEIKQTFLCLSQKISGILSEEDKNMAKILCYVLGQGNTSRLNKILRNEKGLIYNINTSLVNEPDYNFLSISTNCNVINTKEVINIIKTEFNKIIKDKITQKELEIARKNLLREIKFNYEIGSYWVNKANMNDLIFNKKYLSINDKLKIIKSIKISNINNFINKYLPDNKLLLSIITNRDFIK